MRIVKEFSKGFTTHLPPFRLVLGLCPVLAVTTTVANGIGMGLAATFVLVCSNVLVSLLRKVIPSKVRIACFIVLIATFVVIVEIIMKAFFFPLSQSLGIFIPLIVVNCIILGRAEAFAAKNPVHLAAVDGLGIGLGFTLSLAVLGTVREILGAGTFLGTPLFGESFEPFTLFAKAPGAFIGLGVLLFLLNAVDRFRLRAREESLQRRF
ncbi:MAG: electron transport complex subunit E [Candidatus Eisenbacteria sp.]|nr:electron transport complex subunit E [Candidatus Eisenbacteria bacterium]